MSIPESAPTIADTVRLRDVSQLVSASAAWIDSALRAWSDDDFSKVALLAPLAVELLGKAVLWNENPVLVVPLTSDAETTLFGLATNPRLADPKLRTVGLAILLRRLDSFLGGLPIDKAQRARMVEVRNGAVHVGAPSQSRYVLVDSLIMCNRMLISLKEEPKRFYDSHYWSVQELLDQKRTEVGHRVTAKRARARLHLNELEERLGTDLFSEATDRLEDEASNELDPDHLFSSDWAVDALCPECGSRGRLQGPIDLDASIDFDVSGIGGGHYSAKPYQTGWDVTLTPTSFACNVCRLTLNGSSELLEGSLPSSRHSIDIDDLGEEFDPDLESERLYGIRD